MRSPVRLLPALLLGLVVSLAFAGVASADFLTPEDGGSPNADTIDDLYKMLLILGIIVFVGVEGALIYSMVKFRARKGAVPSQIRGNTRLEIGWTVGAALILVVVAVVTFVQLGDIRNPPESDPEGLKLTAANVTPEEPDTPIDRAVPKSGRSLKIKVNGQQYVWRFTYPDDDDDDLNNAFSYEEMVVPTDTTVTLEITAQDVVHSWWIPAMGGKFDAVPGHTNYTWLKVPGRLAGRTFRGQCAELCGRNHANMVAKVRAVRPDEYERWIANRKREIAAGNREAARQREEQQAEGQKPDAQTQQQTEDQQEPE